MKLKSKLVGLNILGQTMFAIIFFSALYVSYNAITEKLHSASLLERYSDDALDIYLILHLADSGDGDGVRESLNLKLDNYVYEIHYLLENEREASRRERALGILRKIAAHREAFPRAATNILQQDVDSILEGIREIK